VIYACVGFTLITKSRPCVRAHGTAGGSVLSVEPAQRLNTNQAPRNRTVDETEIDRALARRNEEDARHHEREIEDVRAAERQVVRDALARLTPTPWTILNGFVAIMSDPQYRDGGR
jgi:hypothetical protein